MVEIRLYVILTILVIFAACGIQPDNDEETDPRPRQVSSIKVIADLMDSRGGKITLESPKPFQTFNELDVSGDINFQFSPWVENGEIYIFDEKPDINALRAGDTSGCRIGSSALAGHYWHGEQVTLSAIESQNQFYKCLSGVDLLSPTEKQALGVGDYYWFVISYDSNYLIHKSSDIRLFTIE